MRKYFSYIEITLYALLVYFLWILFATYFEAFLREKCFFPVKIKCLRQTENIFMTKKEIQINWEIFVIVIVTDAKFHVEIRVLITCLFDLILTSG